MEDEIDLRPYLAILVRRWKWLIAVPLLITVAVAAALQVTAVPVYEATATVLIAAPLGANNAQLLLPAQMQLALVQGTEVGTKAAQTLGETFSAGEKNAIASGVGITVVRGDSILVITANADTADKALELANAWAVASVAVLNQEQERVAGLSLSSLKQSTAAASTELQTAEAKLRALESNAQIDLLTQEMTRTAQILNTQTAERENARSALAQAQALRSQVQQGQISLSPEMLLSLQVTATAAGTTMMIQPAQIANSSKQQQLDQLDAIVAALNARVQALDTSIAAYSEQGATFQQRLSEKQSTLAGPRYAWLTANGNYQSTLSQLQSAQQRLALNYQVFTALTRSAASGAPVTRPVTQSLIIAAAAALALTVCGIYAVELLRIR